jgi:ABC-type transport system involved in Fe-S cluster assembly fused permease/ATPase subunit
VEKAAKIANAHQFISELSQGYYTYVGERVLIYRVDKDKESPSRERFYLIREF